MIKKLIKFICFAAVLTLPAQFLIAQQHETEATDPTSSTSEATAGRIINDVDMFLSVNDWADVQMDKWFSYLKAEDIAANNDWQGGLALKLSKAYIGLYYHGRYNTGTQAEGLEDINNGDFTNTATIGGNAPLYNYSPALGNSSVQHANYFGILLGIGNHGFKFTLLDNMDTTDVNNVVSVAGLTDAYGNEVPEGSKGYYRRRGGNIVPRLEWGAAQPMQLGKYSTKPKAYLEFDVRFANQIEWGFGETYRYESFTGNMLIPKLGLDTGSIGFLEGDWGRITAGLVEEIQVTVSNTGSSGIDSWENLLKPYVGFTYNPVPFFRLGAQLDIPVYAGNTAGTFIGIGKSNYPEELPSLAAGFQLKGSVFQKIAEKIGIIDQFDFNFGIKVALPGYKYSDGYSYDAGTDEYPHNSVQITKTPTHQWLNPAEGGSALQAVSAGVTFYITPKILLDWTIAADKFVRGTNNIMRLDFLNPNNSLLLTIKH